MPYPTIDNLPVVDDPVLERLLIEHVEPKMQEILKRFSWKRSDDGTRKICSFERNVFSDFGRTAGYTHPTEKLVHIRIRVAYNKDGNMFVFEIYKDGSVYG